MMFCRILLLLLCLPLVLCAEDKAYVKYKQGEVAPDTEARKTAFNEALTLYLQMEGQHPSSKLCFDIANSYFQLGEFGYAILYYYKALKEDPRNTKAFTNLQIAQTRAGLPVESSTILHDYIFFFYFKLSHNEKAIAVLLLLFVVFTIFSVHLWLPQPFLRNLGIIGLWVTGILFLSLFWADNLASPEAVVVKPVALKRDAGEQYGPISGNPALSGMNVTVLWVSPDGNWMRVRMPTGEVGYISKENARII